MLIRIFFFEKKIGGHWPLYGTTDIGLLLTSALGFKASVDPLACMLRRPLVRDENILKKS